MRRLFFGQYIRNVRTVGAVAPSSRFLADKMLRQINFKTTKTIVEYGPGTGVFTTQLVARKNAATKLIIIEQNKAFYDVLLGRYNNEESVTVLHDSAVRIEEILKEQSIERVDYIVSGLPFAALPIEVSDAILKSTVRLIDVHGVFITFQYTLLKKSFMLGFFNNIAVTRELRNIPPAYVFVCTN